MLKAAIIKSFIVWPKRVSFLWIKGLCRSPWESYLWMRLFLLELIRLYLSSHAQQSRRKHPGDSQSCTRRPWPPLHVVHRDPLSHPCLSSFITLEAAKPSTYHDRTRGGFHVVFPSCFECAYALSTTVAKSASELECGVLYTKFPFVIRPNQDDLDDTR